MRFVCPGDHIIIGIGEGGFKVRPREIDPLKTIGFSDAPCGGVVGDGLCTLAIYGIADIAPKGVVVAGEGLRIEARNLFGGELPQGIVSKSSGADGIGSGSLAPHRIIDIGDAGRGVGIIDRGELAPTIIGVGGDNLSGIGACGEFAIVGVSVNEALTIGISFGEEDAGDLNFHRLLHKIQNKRFRRPTQDRREQHRQPANLTFQYTHTTSIAYAYPYGRHYIMYPHTLSTFFT